jgi:hypothetical protein
MLVDRVASHTIGRANIVIGMKVKKGALEIFNQSFVVVGNRNAGGASFPNSHQPNSVEAVSGDGVPLG